MNMMGKFTACDTLLNDEIHEPYFFVTGDGFNSKKMIFVPEEDSEDLFSGYLQFT